MTQGGGNGGSKRGWSRKGKRSENKGKENFLSVTGCSSDAFSLFLKCLKQKKTQTWTCLWTNPESCWYVYSFTSVNLLSDMNSCCKINPCDRHNMWPCLSTSMTARFNSEPYTAICSMHSCQISLHFVTECSSKSSRPHIPSFTPSYNHQHRQFTEKQAGHGHRPKNKPQRLPKDFTESSALYKLSVSVYKLLKVNELSNFPETSKKSEFDSVIRRIIHLKLSLWKWSRQTECSFHFSGALWLQKWNFQPLKQFKIGHPNSTALENNHKTQNKEFKGFPKTSECDSSTLLFGLVYTYSKQRRPEKSGPCLFTR